MVSVHEEEEKPNGSLPFGGFMLLWTVDGRNKGISHR